MRGGVAPKRAIAGRRVSGMVGVPPAVLRVPRSTRRTSHGERTSRGVRMYFAGRGMRRAGRPPYPRPAAPPRAGHAAQPASHAPGVSPRFSPRRYRMNRRSDAPTLRARRPRSSPQPMLDARNSLPPTGRESACLFSWGGWDGGNKRPAPNGAALPRGQPMKRGSSFTPDGRNRTAHKQRPARRVSRVIPGYFPPARRGARDGGVPGSARFQRVGEGVPPLRTSTRVEFGRCPRSLYTLREVRFGGTPKPTR